MSLLSTDDPEAAAAAAPELGGSVGAPSFEAGIFRRTVLADPHGAVFSASQLQHPS
jgi:predicted enzyme related to lactoylglutathione lyase